MGGGQGKPGQCFTLSSLCGNVVFRGAETTEHVKRMSVQYVKVQMGFSEGRGQLRGEWEVSSIITHPPCCHSLASIMCAFLGVCTAESVFVCLGGLLM